MIPSLACPPRAVTLRIESDTLRNAESAEAAAARSDNSRHKPFRESRSRAGTAVQKTIPHARVNLHILTPPTKLPLPYVINLHEAMNFRRRRSLGIRGGPALDRKPAISG